MVFSKNQQDNITENELRALQRLAKELLNYDDGNLEIAIRAGEIIEVL